jgi:hypothetical protein
MKRIAALALIMSGLLLAAQASAAVTSSSYHAGWTRDPGMAGGASSWTQASILTGNGQAGRSDYYSGTQYIRATYYLYRWNGSQWALSASLSDGAWVGPGSHVQFGSRRFWVNGYNRWTVNVRYTWQRPSGSLIGYRTRRHVHYSDYSCYANGTGVCKIQYVGGRYGVFLWAP